MQFYHIVFYVLHLTSAKANCFSQSGFLTEYVFLQPDFKDKLVSRYLLNTHVKENKMHCAISCMQDGRCVSFTFKMADGSCRLLGISFSGVDIMDVDPGVNLFYLSGAIGYIGYPCLNDTDCKAALSMCNNGVCDCNIGYSFSVDHGGCVRYCETYGNDFTAYIERGLIANNLFSDWGYSEKDCLQLCVDEPTYNCLTVERYPADGFCTLTNTTWFDVLEAERDSMATGYVFYHRNCAVK